MSRKFIRLCGKRYLSASVAVTFASWSGSSSATNNGAMNWRGWVDRPRRAEASRTTTTTRNWISGSMGRTALPRVAQMSRTILQHHLSYRSMRLTDEIVEIYAWLLPQTDNMFVCLLKLVHIHITFIFNTTMECVKSTTTGIYNNTNKKEGKKSEKSNSTYYIIQFSRLHFLISPLFWHKISIVFQSFYGKIAINRSLDFVFSKWMLV